MHEDALALARGTFDEVEDLLRGFVMFVKEGLVLRILPKEREVHDANRLPKVADLLTSAVDDVGDLVGDYELQILHTRSLAE